MRCTPCSPGTGASTPALASRRVRSQASRTPQAGSGDQWCRCLCLSQPCRRLQRCIHTAALALGLPLLLQSSQWLPLASRRVKGPGPQDRLPGRALAAAVAQMCRKFHPVWPWRWSSPALGPDKQPAVRGLSGVSWGVGSEAAPAADDLQWRARRRPKCALCSSDTEVPTAVLAASAALGHPACTWTLEFCSAQVFARRP